MTDMMTEEEFLKHTNAFKHAGVKGMKWGVRKAEVTSSSKVPLTDEQRKIRNKKILIATGSAVAVVGLIATAVILQKSGKLSLNSFSKSVGNSAKVKTVIDKVDDVPVGIIHSSRAKYAGHSFINSGGVKDPLIAYSKSPLQDGLNNDGFKKYGDGLNLVAARFLDPEGRTDRAGRAIGHELIFPNNLVPGVNSIQDVKEKVWPLVKNQYDAYYNADLSRDVV
jgi:hypothetical protein